MAEIIWAKEIRPGMTYLDGKGNIFKVIENTFNKTCQAKAVIKVRVRNLRKGGVSWEVLSEDKYEKAETQTPTMTFSYIDGDNYVFMDETTYEQVEVPLSKLEWEKNFLVEGGTVRMLKYGDEILGIDLPDKVTLVVKEAENAVRGDTANAASKKAWLANGFEVKVPQFIEAGEKIILSTVDGTYSGREGKTK